MRAGKGEVEKEHEENEFFTPNALLEFVAIDILGELITAMQGNRYILVISDRYSKLVRTVPLKKISAAHITQAFVHHRVFLWTPFEAAVRQWDAVHSQIISEHLPNSRRAQFLLGNVPSSIQRPC